MTVMHANDPWLRLDPDWGPNASDALRQSRRTDE
jgi:hypothetical protein